MIFKDPDYDRSLLSVTASVLNHYGAADCPHKTLPEFDAVLAKDPKNVVIILCDGMGSHQLAFHLPEDSFLRSHKVADISSVFPPTTTAATVTVLSGKSPAEHSWLGWDLYFSELDANVTTFLGVLQDTETKAADFDPANTFIPYKTVFQRINESAPDVHTHYISAFGDEKFPSFKANMERVRQVCAMEGRSFSYVYWDEPDHCMHFKGTFDSRVTEHIKGLNDQIEALCSDVEDTVVVVIADHGQTNVRWKYLSGYPRLYNMLLRAPSLEARALSLYVKDGMADEFKTEFEKEFGDEMLLLTKAQVYERGLFGPGTPGEHTDGFIGDFIALSRSDLCIGFDKNKDILLGNHAGLSEEEVTVPFILCDIPPRSLLSATLNTRFPGVSSRVRKGAFIRSDKPYMLTDADIEKLRELGVDTVIDMRAQSTAERRPNTVLPFADYFSCPIPEGEPIPATPELVPVSYMDFARSRCMPEVFHILARSKGTALFHCTAGKDRTGFVSAVLLGIAGMSDDDIIADYMLTWKYLSPMFERIRKTSPEVDLGVVIPKSWYMREFLSAFRSEYGSFENYLLTVGLSEEEISSLKSKLI